MLPLLVEINRSIEAFGPISARRRTKFTGAVTVEIVRRHLEANGLPISSRNVFIRGNSTEWDLLLIRRKATPEARIVFDPVDVAAALEVKYSGIYNRDTLPRLRSAFDQLTSAHPSLRCTYVTMLEREGFTYAATASSLGYPAFTLHWWKKSREDPNESGDWEKLIEFLREALNGQSVGMA